MAWVVLQYDVVSAEDNLLKDEQPTQADAVSETPVTTADTAAVEACEKCLLALARAVETVGMYGSSHPSSKHEVGEWFKRLSSLLRMRGTFTVGTDGQVAFVEGTPFSTTNPVILSVLRRLYTSRAGRLDLLSGFREEDALKLAGFLANANESQLAGEENTLETWIERNRMYHVRVRQIEFREVKEGDRVIAGERLQPNRRSKPTDDSRAKSAGPKEVGTWARKFQTEADQASKPASLPGEVRDGIASQLRGLTSDNPLDLAENVMQAAANPAQLAELLLKIALVQHEVAKRTDQPVGTDVVTCLRSVFEAMQQAPEMQTDEGWANMARMLAVLEEYILGKQHEIAGGTDGDAEIIREGMRSIQRDVEGGALRREYDQKRGALVAVEQKVRQFFGVEREKPVDVTTDSGPAQ
jgi:hypothetical protein